MDKITINDKEYIECTEPRCGQEGEQWGAEVGTIVLVERKAVDWFVDTERIQCPHCKGEGIEPCAFDLDNCNGKATCIVDELPCCDECKEEGEKEMKEEAELAELKATAVAYHELCKALLVWESDGDDTHTIPDEAYPHVLKEYNAQFTADHKLKGADGKALPPSHTFTTVSVPIAPGISLNLGRK